MEFDENRQIQKIKLSLVQLSQAYYFLEEIQKRLLEVRNGNYSVREIRNILRNEIFYRLAEADFILVKLIPKTRHQIKYLLKQREEKENGQYFSDEG